MGIQYKDHIHDKTLHYKQYLGSPFVVIKNSGHGILG